MEALVQKIFFVNVIYKPYRSGLSLYGLSKGKRSNPLQVSRSALSKATYN